MAMLRAVGLIESSGTSARILMGRFISWLDVAANTNGVVGISTFFTESFSSSFFFFFSFFLALSRFALKISVSVVNDRFCAESVRRYVVATLMVSLLIIAGSRSQ